MSTLDSDLTPFNATTFKESPMQFQELDTKKITQTQGPKAQRTVSRSSTNPSSKNSGKTVINIFKRNLKNINGKELTHIKQTLLIHQLVHHAHVTILETSYEARHKAYKITTTSNNLENIKAILDKALNHSTYNYHSSHSRPPAHFKLHLDKHLSRSYLNQSLYSDLSKPLILTPTQNQEILNIIAPPIEHQNHRGSKTYTIQIEQTATLTEALKQQKTPYTTTHMRNSKVKWRANNNPN